MDSLFNKSVFKNSCLLFNFEFHSINLHLKFKGPSFFRKSTASRNSTETGLKSPKPPDDTKLPLILFHTSSDYTNLESTGSSL